MELGGRDAANAPETLDGERMEEAEFVVGRYDEEAVRLRDRARDLREEFRASDAHGDRKPDLVEDSAPEPGCDLGRRACESLEPSDVEERLVDRKALHERRRVLEECEDGLARLGVGRHSRGNDDGLRAESAGLVAAHRRLDAVGLRFVAGREHDTPTDDHRPSAQARIVALLDRREERIEVGMENARLSHGRTYVRTRRPPMPG